MKKLIFLLLMMLIATPCFAQVARMSLGVVGGQVPVSGPDCTCAGGSFEEGAVERFESGVGTLCTIPKTGEVWTLFTAGTGAIVTYSTADIGDACGHTGTFKANADSDRACLYFAAATASDDFSVQFSFKVSDFTSWANNDIIQIADFGNAGYVALIYYDSQSGVVVSHSMSGSQEFITAAESGNIAADTWYTIVYNFHRADAGYVKIYSGIGTTGSLLFTDNIATCADTALGRYGLGLWQNAAHTGWTGTVTMENIKFTAGGL